MAKDPYESKIITVSDKKREGFYSMIRCKNSDNSFIFVLYYAQNNISIHFLLHKNNFITRQIIFVWQLCVSGFQCI